ncbi:hypothetical protein L1887_56608 [Cichorium endivia]|nr:hypothetical protein L1887_56608 [Cichorium endivia]
MSCCICCAIEDVGDKLAVAVVDGEFEGVVVVVRAVGVLDWRHHGRSRGVAYRHLYQHAYPCSPTALRRQRVLAIELAEVVDRHVLALRELEQRLDAVDDAHASQLVDGRNVAGAQEAVVGERLLGLGLVLVVAGEGALRLAEQLAARERLVVRGVAHVGNVAQLELHAGVDGTHRAERDVVGRHDGAEAVVLGLAVTLAHVARQHDAKQLEHIAANGGGARDNVLDTTAEQRLDLAEDEAVVERVCEGAVAVVVCDLGGERLAEERALEAGGGGLCLDECGDAVEHAWHRGEHLRLEDGHVLEEAGGVAAEVADPAAGADGDDLTETRVDVCGGEVGDERVGAALVEGHGGGDVTAHASGDDGGLGVAGGARGVAEGVDGVDVGRDVGGDVVAAEVEDLEPVEDFDAAGLCPLLCERVAERVYEGGLDGLLGGAEGVEDDNGLEQGQLAGLCCGEDDADVVGGGEEDARLCMVDDVLGGSGVVGLVEADGPARVGDVGVVDDHEFGPVESPDADGELGLADAVTETALASEGADTRADGGALLLDLLVGVPFEVLFKVLGDGVPGSPAGDVGLEVLVLCTQQGFVDGAAGGVFCERGALVDGRETGLL